MSILSELILTGVRESVEKTVEEFASSLAEHIAEETQGDAEAILQAIMSFTGIQSTQTKPQKSTKRKSKSEGGGEVIIVTDYSDKTHGIFGDTESIKDTILKPLNSGGKVVSYNKYLKYGPGWIVMNKKQLQTIKNAFDKNRVNYKVISNSEYAESMGITETHRETSGVRETTTGTSRKTPTRKNTPKRPTAKKNVRSVEPELSEDLHDDDGEDGNSENHGSNDNSEDEIEQIKATFNARKTPTKRAK